MDGTLIEEIHRFARSISRHEQEAADLVQDALEKSLSQENLTELPIYKQRAWFFRVMKNQLIDDRRKEARLSFHEEDFELPQQPVAMTPIEMSELLGQLEPELSSLVFKRYWLGMNSTEIGEQLGMPAATVRYKLHFAMKLLKTYLEDDD